MAEDVKKVEEKITRMEDKTGSEIVQASIALQNEIFASIGKHNLPIAINMGVLNYISVWLASYGINQEEGGKDGVQG